MNPQEEERIKLGLYKKFYEDNKDLMKQNPSEYTHRQRLYIEEELEKVKYNLK